MKSILQFARTTITGGILFMLPVVLLITAINKARSILERLSEPLAKKLPDFVLGFDGSKLVAIVLLLLICFLSGLLFRSGRVRRWISSLESGFLSYLPGYAMMKSITAAAIGEKVGDNLPTVLVADGDNWKIGFLSDESNGFCTVFFPGAPQHDSGEVAIVPASIVRKTEIPSNVAVKSLKGYGKGAIQWLKNP